ncbi:MAG: hypothetical protein Ta2A_18850 [Treponemataceae bacterium]|nr:MAG: hypothetical protein Ta2A_18850 [Treponemataceae bacterium]
MQQSTTPPQSGRGMLFFPRNCTQVRIPFFRPKGRGMHPFGSNQITRLIDEVEPDEFRDNFKISIENSP